MNKLTKDNFEKTVRTGVHLIVFWAPWCGPCRMQTPILEELDKEYKDEVLQISKVNVDEEPELAAIFQIQSIPTLMVVANGKVANRLVGVRMKEQLKEEMEQYL